MISAIVPILNGEKWIRGAIESFLKQKGNKELLVIDSSSDTTEEIVRSYKGVNYHRVDFDGAFEKMNYGLDLVKGDIIVAIGCDDEFTEGCFEIVEKNTKTWLYGNMILVDEERKELSRTHLDPYSLELYKKKNIVPGNAFVKASLIKDMRYNPKYRFNADYDFFLRLAHKYPPKQMNDYLIKMMIRGNRMSGGDNMLQANKDREEIRRQYA